MSLLVRRARCTPSPDSLAVSDSCFSRSVRSVTTTTLKARSSWIGPHRPHQEHHGQRLARALGVPDQATAAVVLAILRPRLAGPQPLQRPADSAVLLVAGDDLDALAVDLGEQA